MKSKILQKDRDDLIRLSKQLTPEERLVAFFNHSRLTTAVYRAGLSKNKKQNKK